MSDLKLRRRVRLKGKQSKQIREQLAALYGGGEFWSDSSAVETADVGDFQVIVVDNEVIGFQEPFLSIRGLLRWPVSARYVTVDMGAVRFVTNGADVMAPGITDADPGLQEGDLCWIRDEKNGKPLAIGRCLMPGAVMGGADKGKAVAMVHHIGDKLWTLE